jgi:hypothetical protein
MPSTPARIAIQIHAITARAANTFGKFALRTIFLLAAIFIPAVASAMARLPFMPISRQPDYVVTMVESLYGKEVAKRNVVHHGDWTRVDRIEGTYRFVGYYSVNGVVAVHDQRRVSSTFLSRGGIDLSHRGYRPRNTGERQAHLDETCTVWEVSRPSEGAPSDSGDFHLSCVTDDGIELWQRSLYGSKVISSAEATRVERRPLTADEVKPPRTLLTLDWWDRGAPTSGASAMPGHETTMELPGQSADAGKSVRTTRQRDQWQSMEETVRWDRDAPTLGPSAIPGHETIMELSGQSADAGKSIRTTRQRGQWRSMEETVSGIRRRLELVHDSGGMGFEYAWDEAGAPKRLAITRPASTPEGTAAATSAMWNETNRSETILGETCRWFYLMTNGHSGRSRCQTDDGVVLRDHHEWRALEGQEVVREWTAVRMTRRQVNLDEIKPSAELFDPHVWGIE